MPNLVEMEGLLTSSDGLTLKVSVIIEDREGEADVVSQDIQDMFDNYMDQYETPDVVEQLRQNLNRVVYGF